MIHKAPAPDALDALADAASGLLFPGESDAPLTPYRWAGTAAPTPEALLQAEKRAPETPVETVEVADFFGGLTTPRAGASEAERTEAARWRALVALLGERLQDLRVYRVGAVDIDAFILGRDPAGVWLGLRTHLVET